MGIVDVMDLQRFFDLAQIAGIDMNLIPTTAEGAVVLDALVVPREENDE